MKIDKTKMIHRPLSFALALLTQCCLVNTTSALVNNNLSYGYVYWENGNPDVSARRGNLVNQLAENNPDVVIQTGYYSLRLDCDDMALTGYNALSGSNYMSALSQDVTTHTPATLNLFVYKNGIRYQCKSGIAMDSTGSNVRLIEAGQYLQRFDHQALVFEDTNGNELGVYGRLEISAWPDRATFSLDFRDVNGNALTTGITRSTIQLISPSSTQHLADSMQNNVSLTIQPHLDVKLSSVTPSSYISDAKNANTSTALSYSFDSTTHAINLQLDTSALSFPQDIDWVDEYTIEITNPSSSEVNLPLVFDEASTPGAVTGTSMVLLNDDQYDSPSGQPVQISKNWHGPTEPIIHRGYWLRGSTMVTLAANETKLLRLKVIRGNWSGEPAASHAHLSVIGYGGNWKWDESALGAWGESMCFDPTQALGGSFITDVRPSYTTPLNGGTHNWTENAGGGDFLIYYDSSNTFHFQKRIKTAYRWTGPNLTEIHYSGVTDDDKIRFTYVNQLGSTFDYQRRFLKFKYEFLQNVTSPGRLAFFQMASDRYPGSQYDYYDLGDDTGWISTHSVQAGGNAYQGSFAFDDRWLAIDDLTSLGGNTSHARRGIIARDMTLNGNSTTPYMHKWGNTWGSDRMFFDLSLNSVSHSYSTGDVVEGGIEFIMPPIDDVDYWGSDTEFSARLATHQTEWQAVYDEVVNNANLSVTAYTGTLLESYPVKIQANTSNSVYADFQMNSGGIGSVPVILTGVPAGNWISCQRRVNGSWSFLENVNITKCDYYQGYQNADGTMDYVFTLKRPTTNLNDSWRIRILKGW